MVCSPVMLTKARGSLSDRPEYNFASALHPRADELLAYVLRVTGGLGGGGHFLASASSVL
jgi:hypothetical protein